MSACGRSWTVDDADDGWPTDAQLGVSHICWRTENHDDECEFAPKPAKP